MAQRDEVIEAITRSDEGEADVATPELVHNVIGHLQDEVHAILRPHHTQIGGEMGSGASEARFRCGATKSGQVGPRADDSHARWRDAVPVRGRSVDRSHWWR